MGKARPGLRAAVVVDCRSARARSVRRRRHQRRRFAATWHPDRRVGRSTYLTNAEQFDKVDPQRIYTGEDLAFFSGTIFRTLTAYKFSKDADRGHLDRPRPRHRHGHADRTAARPGRSRCATASRSRPVTRSPAPTSSTASRARSRPTSSPVARRTRSRCSTSRRTTTGDSQYAGPYKGTGQDLFDKAVTCSADGKTITFNLNAPGPGLQLHHHARRLRPRAEGCGHR